MRLSRHTNPRAIPDKVPGVIESREVIFGIAVVLLVAAISIAITLQGWRSRVPAFDVLTYIYSIRNFLETGALPRYGDTGSYGSLSPPGTAWLMLPSTILFADPRLSEYVGTALLHFSTLLGLFLLARSYFGVSCASLAVLLYGLSEHALFFAGSLWPIGRPDFYIWVVYLASRWVAGRNARYLAAALAVWGLGMYVDMAIAPVLFILPALWLYYEPPVHLKPLLVAGGIVLIVWTPYLRFEASRGFADIRSQLVLQPIFPANYRVTWCDPSLTLRRFEEPSSTSPTDLAQADTSPNRSLGRIDRLFGLVSVAEDKVLSNFQPVAPVPEASRILLLLTLSSLLILSVSGSSSGRTELVPRLRFWRDWLKLSAIGMITCGVLVSGLVTIASLFGGDGALGGSKILYIYKLRTILVLSGLALLAGSWIAAAANRALARFGVQIQAMERANMTRLLVFSLLIPWFILLLLAEPDKPERFIWLWPLQSMFLAAFFANVLPRFRVPRATIWAGQIMVVLIVAGNFFLLSRVGSWARTGWTGPDAEEIQVVDSIARQTEAEGKNQAAIGYQTFIYPFMANYNITNPIYKVGAEFDLLFLYRHRIVNTNQCAEGVAGDDEYRIVQTRPKPPVQFPRDYFVVPMDSHFRLIYQVGHYQVYKRD